jgi:hypothetical protein
MQVLGIGSQLVRGVEGRIEPQVGEVVGIAGRRNAVGDLDGATVTIQWDDGTREEVDGNELADAMTCECESCHA